MPGFINIDQQSWPAVDYVAEISELPCPPNSVERIESYHLIEHIPHTEVRDILKKWYGMLKPEGSIIIECPDFDRDIAEYSQGNTDRLYSIFGHQRYPGDAHHFGYNAERITAVLSECGFVSIQVSEGTDYHAEKEPCLRVECSK